MNPISLQCSYLLKINRSKFLQFNLKRLIGVKYFQLHNCIILLRLLGLSIWLTLGPVSDFVRIRKADLTVPPSRELNNELCDFVECLSTKPVVTITRDGDELSS